MARDFDGANDEIEFGSDASVDDFTTKTISLWMIHDTDQTDILMGKGQSILNWIFAVIATAQYLRYDQDFDGATNGVWQSPNSSIPLATLKHVAVTYDRSSSANNPQMYVDGVAVTTTRTTTPAGNSTADAAYILHVGEDEANANDFDGRLLALCYDNQIWTDAQVNRAKWWGIPFGPTGIKVYHPLFTDSLVNKGTATADGTATGTTMASLPRVERCWAATMGCGR